VPTAESFRPARGYVGAAPSVITTVQVMPALTSTPGFIQIVARHVGFPMRERAIS